MFPLSQYEEPSRSFATLRSPSLFDLSSSARSGLRTTHSFPYDKSTAARPSPCFLYLSSGVSPVRSPLCARLRFSFCLASARTPSERCPLSPTISQHRLVPRRVSFISVREVLPFIRRSWCAFAFLEERCYKESYNNGYSTDTNCPRS